MFGGGRTITVQISWLLRETYGGVTPVTEVAGPMVWRLPDQAVLRVLEESVVSLALDDR